jgi:hypothetical protein
VLVVRVMADALSALRPGRVDAPAVSRRRVPAGLRIGHAAVPQVVSLDGRLSGGGTTAALLQTPWAAAEPAG